MSGRVVEASAPTRVDLAGGTLDIWPVYLWHPGACTVNVAIDRRAWCRVETGEHGVLLRSQDTRTELKTATLTQALAEGSLGLLAQILRALGVEQGISVTTRSRVPEGSGLGGSSALAVAVAAGVARAFDRELSGDALCALVRDAEARHIRVPTGVQDYLAAIHGGVLDVRLEAGGVRAERLDADPGQIEECLLLVQPGGARFSGINNWEVFRARVEGDPGVTDALENIAEAARGVRDALVAGRADQVTAWIDREWEARKRLAAGVTTPEIDAVVARVRAEGGAAKVCGAGGGGLVAVWAPPGARDGGVREAVEGALEELGLTPLGFRVDLRGLEVS